MTRPSVPTFVALINKLRIDDRTVAFIHSIAVEILHGIDNRLGMHRQSAAQ